MKSRHPQFSFDIDLPRFWHSNDPFKTYFFNSFSILISPGERFFIDVMRKIKCSLDSSLASDVDLFIKQEAIHSRIHNQYNRLLKEQGYPVDYLQSFGKKRLNWFQNKTHVKTQLAAVLASEHITAVMSRLALGNKDLLAGAHPEFVRLWKWHAAEELEHKSVAFDVYKQLGGGYWRRAFQMLLYMLTLSLDSNRTFRSMLVADKGRLSVFQCLKSFGRYLVFSRFIIATLPAIFSFFSPKFDPSKDNDDYLLDRWEESFAQESINPKSDRGGSGVGIS